MLTNWERETIITFNEEEKIAYLWTYNKTWQRQLEEKLGLKPTLVNGRGGKEYELPKKMIKMPRAPKNLTPQQRKDIADRLHRNKDKSFSKRSSKQNLEDGKGKL